MTHYREPFKEPSSRKPVWRWPNEIPIEGKPPDVVDAFVSYNAKLQESDLPKLLFHATPGVFIDASTVQWCQQNLKNLRAVDVGEGIHWVQEDNPNLIGSELANWYSSL